MLWRVCKGYTILSYAEVDENLADLETVSHLHASGATRLHCCSIAGWPFVCSIVRLSVRAQHSSNLTK